TALLVAFVTSVLSAAALIISKAALDPSENDVAVLRRRVDDGRPVIQTLEIRLAGLRARYRRLSADYRWQIEYRNAVRAYDKIRRIADSLRYQLLHADWKSLRGVPFEDFVASVFEVLG